MTRSRQTAAKAGLDAELLLDLYGRMLLLRRFEEEMQRLFLKGEIHGTLHLYIGQEASAVGVCSALTATDTVSATYRGHGAALAQGVEPEALAAELLGRTTGSCGGRAGSMNVIDLEHGLIGSFGIVGGSIAAATGAGLAGKAEGRVAVAFFGDGATNQAYFHECLNFAKVHRLPCLFVCENNGYGEFTPMAQVTAGADIAGRARAFDIPAETVDGNDVEAVHAAAHAAAERARAGEGPSLVETLTYRHLGHSKSDPGRYRPAEEVEAWKARDPLPATRARLTGALAVAEADVTAAEEAVEQRLAAAIERALAAPYPDPVTDAARQYA